MRGDASGTGGSLAGGGDGAGRGDDGREGDGRGDGLPVSLETAWGLRERPAKGPKPGLSLGRIVATAVGIAAADGIEAVTMGRVAKELGASTMSLYRYVGARDELYVLMQEAAVGPPPEGLVPPGTGWREGLTRWATALREGYRRHLWVLRIPVYGPPASPNAVDWWEQGLGALAGTGLDEGTKTGVVVLVTGFVRSESLLAADLEAAHRTKGVPPEVAMARYGRTLQRLVDRERHPALVRMMEAGVLEEADDPDAEFTFGLGTVLDGVEVLVGGLNGPGEAPR